MGTGGLAQIKDYQIVVGCTITSGSVVRYRELWLTTSAVQGDPATNIFIKFSEVMQPNLGSYKPDSEQSWVLAHAPFSDSEEMYQVLREEKSTLFSWAANDQKKLEWFQISSGKLAEA
jgi:hypothetical protein